MVFFLFAGCKTTHHPVPIYGTENETASLVGNWQGVYESFESGRHGTIYFSLQAYADSAFGHIIMKPGTWEDEYKGDRKFTSSHTSELLTIRFVSIGMGRVVGRLDEYRDPNCGCFLETIFAGRLEGDHIEGEYHNDGEGFHIDTNGTWSMERVSGAPEVHKIIH